jgi:hypothetical protein
LISYKREFFYRIDKSKGARIMENKECTVGLKANASKQQDLKDRKRYDIPGRIR